MKIKILARNFDITDEFLASYSGRIDRASDKGLKKVGYYIARKEIKSFIKESPEFSGPSVLTVNYKSSYRKQTKIKRRVLPRRRTFQYLSGMSKYNVTNNTLSVGWGYSRDFSSNLTKIAKRVEKGHYTRVTPRMRRYFGNTLLPLKKSTKYLRTKPKPIISKVMGNIKSGYVQVYETKFSKKLGD